MSRPLLCLAKSLSDPVAVIPAADVVRAMLHAWLPWATDSALLVTQAADLLRRGLNLDVSGAYRADPEQPGGLALVARHGLPDEFADVARRLPLCDFDQVADLPYNDEHGLCYGDFFAAVVGAFGVRSWLVASLTDLHTGDVIGALLLGSRDGRRFGHEESRQALALASVVAEHLAMLIPNEDTYGLAAHAQAA